MIISNFTIDKSIINNEITVLNNILAQQRQLKKTLLLYLEKISEVLYNATDIEDTNSLISCLNSIKKSFENIKNNINELNELKLYLEKISKLDTFNPAYFEKYNNKFLTLFEKISDDNIFYYSFIESVLKYMKIILPEKDFDSKFSKSDLQPSSNKLDNTTPHNNNNNNNDVDNQSLNKIDDSKKLETTNTEISKINLENNNQDSVVDIQNQTFLEHTLLICEKQGFAVLPYSVMELENCFSNNPEKYSSIQDIINKEYTISLKNYKNVASARFRETFNLAKNKCHLSFIKSFNLANELFFNSNLNPLIITACKNMDELDIYLSCLDDNILDKFKCFNILYA